MLGEPLEKLLMLNTAARAGARDNASATDINEANIVETPVIETEAIAVAGKRRLACMHTTAWVSERHAIHHDGLDHPVG